MIRLTETRELASPLGASRRLIPASPAPSRQNQRQRRINWKRIEQSAALFVADEQAWQQSLRAGLKKKLSDFSRL